MAHILKSVSTQILEDLYFHDHPDAKGTSVKKKEIVDRIADKIDHLAVEIVVAALDKEHLTGLAEKHKVEFKAEDNKKSMSVLQRRVAHHIEAAGLDDFLKAADDDTLKALSADLESDSKTAKDLAEQARTLGAERYFTSFDVESLRSLADELKLKHAAKSSSKRKLVDAIVNQEDSEAVQPKKKKAKVEVSKKKKALEKGITYDEIFQHYYMEELRDWLKEKGVKSYGKKPLLIKRALAFLDGHTDGILVGQKSVSKKKKSTKKVAAKKAAPKKVAASKKKENGDKE